MKLIVFVLISGAFMFQHVPARQLPVLILCNDHGKWEYGGNNNDLTLFPLITIPEIIRIPISL